MPLGKDPDTVLILALACGATVDAASRQCGISERTVYRRLRDAKFQRKIQSVRDDMIQRSAGQLTASALEAGKTLLALLANTTPPAVRLGAARAILEIGIRVREAAELAQRVADLESRIGLKVVSVA